MSEITVTYVVVDRRYDWTVLGLTAEQSAAIDENHWQVVRAQRPLAFGWDNRPGDPTSHTLGYYWTSDALGGIWHFAAGNSFGALPGGKTLRRSWQANDAHAVRLITYDALCGKAEYALRHNPEYVDGYKEMYGDEWPFRVLGQNERTLRVIDKRERQGG